MVCILRKWGRQPSARFGETLIKRQFKQKWLQDTSLTPHCIGTSWLAEESPVKSLMNLCSFNCQRFIGGPRITSYDSLIFR
ncbi:hypothetical protein HAX54_021162, partial [Datura stramonium]|nr:hypothetical protein [Datura stramonium]